MVVYIYIFIYLFPFDDPSPLARLCQNHLRHLRAFAAACLSQESHHSRGATNHRNDLPRNTEEWDPMGPIQDGSTREISPSGAPEIGSKICITRNPPTPAAQGGARKGKGFSDTALVAIFSVLYPPTPTSSTTTTTTTITTTQQAAAGSSRQQQASVGSSRHKQTQQQ